MKEAIESLLPYERDLFFALNGSESQILDDIMWTISGRFVWVPVYLFIIFLFFYKTPPKTAIITTIFFVLVIVVCDQVSSSIFKPMFERFRPTHHPDFKELVDIVNNYRGGRYGFISGHATNSFGLATFLSLLNKNRFVTIITMFWAALNSYTRIYLGVHFISDIIAGMIAGIILSFILYYIYKAICNRYSLLPNKDGALTAESEKAKLLSGVLLLYILLIIIFSPFLSTLPH